jgi:hypothetical protein
MPARLEAEGRQSIDLNVAYDQQFRDGVSTIIFVVSYRGVIIVEGGEPL